MYGPFFASKSFLEGWKGFSWGEDYSVQAVPLFIYERTYQIGYLILCDHRWFFNDSMAVVSYYAIDKANQEAQRLIPNEPTAKEMHWW